VVSRRSRGNDFDLSPSPAHGPHSGHGAQSRVHRHGKGGLACTGPRIGHGGVGWQLHGLLVDGDAWLSNQGKKAKMLRVNPGRRRCCGPGSGRSPVWAQCAAGARRHRIVGPVGGPLRKTCSTTSSMAGRDHEAVAVQAVDLQHARPASARRADCRAGWGGTGWRSPQCGLGKAGVHGVGALSSSSVERTLAGDMSSDSISVAPITNRWSSLGAM
jgi:hypothetical protein